MLRFKEIKEFAETLPCAGPQQCVFPTPYDDLLKSDSVGELFFPRGMKPLSDFLLSFHNFLVPSSVLETMTFSHLLDMVNPPKFDPRRPDRVEVNIPTVFAPEIHFEPVEELDALKGGSIRQFDTGATRDTDEGKFDLEGFLSPLVLERYAEYMNENRKQADGKLRASDNWQKGIPKDAYMKSLYRHFFDTWKEHRGLDTEAGIEVALCGVMFNAMGYLHELLRESHDSK